MSSWIDAPKYHTPPIEKPVEVLKSSTGPLGLASSERPFSCPYEGCEKAYIHEYKLNLHLRREHPGHFPDENAKKTEPNKENDMDEVSDLDAYGGKRNNNASKAQNQNKHKKNLKVPPSKVPQRKNVAKKEWPPNKEVYDEVGTMKRH